MDQELYDFIHSKCLTDTIDIKVSLFLSTIATIKSLTYTIKNSDNQTKIEKKTRLAISCQSITYIVYWTVLTYSNNTKLAMFMVERAILLFNEYINISSVYNIDSFSILDVKQFIIKKTIAPIKIINCQLDVDLLCFYSMFNDFIIKVFSHIVNFKNIDNIDCYDILESISSILLNVSFKLYRNGLIYLVNKELTGIIVQLVDNDISQIVFYTNMAKLKLEIYLALLSKTNCDKTIEHITESVLDNYIDSIDNQAFLSTNGPFLENATFKKCIDLAKTFI